MRSVFQSGLAGDVFCGLRGAALGLTVSVDDVEYKSTIIILQFQLHFTSMYCGYIIQYIKKGIGEDN